jgi:hypothetical protein
MTRDLKFFLTSLNYEINSGGSFKFSDFELVQEHSDGFIYKTECADRNFYLNITPISYKVLVDKATEFSYQTAVSLGTVNNISHSTLTNTKSVAKIILDYVNSEMLEDLVELGTFGFTLIGIQKLESEVKLSFLINGADKKILMQKDGQEYERHIYFGFDKPEAELALILLNISGNGNIQEMVTRFIQSPNLDRPHWNLYNGGVLYELQHSISWAIMHKYYKIQHLKK